MEACRHAGLLSVDRASPTGEFARARFDRNRWEARAAGMDDKAPVPSGSRARSIRMLSGQRAEAYSQRRERP
ncbi:hypothetical protein SLG_37300 [Sphingobium sp. SYK-6]|nr:hypothetical protein SLG_37300 [Sphingobium sp. SYK-6]